MTYRELIAAISDLEEKVRNFERECDVYSVFLGLLDDDDEEFENLRPAEFHKHINRVCEWMSIHADDEIIGDFIYMKTRCNDLYDLVDLMKHFEAPYDMRKAFSDFIEKERQAIVKQLDNVFEEVHGIKE